MGGADSPESYDCVVIGSGPGGYVAAIRAAQLGLRTAIVEKGRLGGRCLHHACIPAKSVLRSADVHDEVSRAHEFGVDVTHTSVDFVRIAKRRRSVIDTLTSGVTQLMRTHDVDVVEGAADIQPGGIIRIGDRSTLYTKRVILAMGSTRRPLPGVDYGPFVLGTEEVWALDQLPARLAVIGAGSSGIEIASAFARLGSQVLLIEQGTRILPSEDEEVSVTVEQSLRRQGVAIHLGTTIADMDPVRDGVQFSIAGQQLTVDYLAIAVGRHPSNEGLAALLGDLERDSSDRVVVDGRMRTSSPGLWAIGDLVRGPALAHKASEEGIVAAEDSAGLDTKEVDYSTIPRVTFCQPNVASVGLTEAQAREAGYDVTVGRMPFRHTGAGVVYGSAEGLIKLVGDQKLGQLLGAHVVGSRAPDLICELVAALALEWGYPELARVVHAHPTISEAILDAARAADGWSIHGPNPPP